jgi:hypothetical protein
MRKPDTGSIAAGKPAFPVGGPDQTPLKMVCLALALALVVLGLRIATIW